jgi:transposase
MFVRAKKREGDKFQIQIVENERDFFTGKVNQKVIRDMGMALNPAQKQVLIEAGESIIIDIEKRRQPVLSFDDPNDFYRSKLDKSRRKKVIDKDLVDPDDLREVKTINEGFFEIFSPIYREIGLDEAIVDTKRDSQWNTIIEDLVIARLKDPMSKLATMSQLEEDFDINIPYQKIYRSLDSLIKNEERIKNKIASYTFNLLDNKVDVLFFDVTTLYFESIVQDDLKDFGFSKDCKFQEVQVLLALIATKEGLPVTYKVFPGNTFEGNSLAPTVEELRKEFNIDRFVFVADRGMFSNSNLEYLESNNYKYVVSSKLRALPKEMKNKILSSNFKLMSDADSFCCKKEFMLEDQNRRLIVNYSTDRARKDAKNRQRLVERVFKKAKKNVVKLKDLIPNHGSKKYIKVINDAAVLNHQKIEDDARWDGLHGIITNDINSNPDELLARYSGLWQIEEAFRVNKNFLKMRPIFHWKPRRIMAHILICFMAYSVLKFSMFKLRRKNIKLSINDIRKELNKVNAVIVKDTRTDKLYGIPTHMKRSHQQIYAAFGVKRNLVPYLI